MVERAIEAVVTGRVQGVGFRAWTRQRAQNLGLRGWVRNQADGSVRALVAGEGALVDAMLRELGQGPAASRVDRVSVTDTRLPDAGGFEIVY